MSHVAWSKCLSVCVCWTHGWTVQNGRTDRDAVWGLTYVGIWWMSRSDESSRSREHYKMATVVYLYIFGNAPTDQIPWRIDVWWLKRRGTRNGVPCACVVNITRKERLSENHVCRILPLSNDLGWPWTSLQLFETLRYIPTYDKKYAC